VTGLLLLNIYAFRWHAELYSERGRRRIIARGLDGIRELDIGSEQLRTAVRAMRPDRAWRLLRRSAEREQADEVMADLEALHRRGVVTLLLYGQGEPLFEALERQGLLSGFSRWSTVTVVAMPSRDHMYRELWLQGMVDRHIDETVRRSARISAPNLAGVLDPQ
jgi:hypothetical protein